jgi:endonuclease YncB( thermonuclease family)
MKNKKNNIILWLIFLCACSIFGVELSNKPSIVKEKGKVNQISGKAIISDGDTIKINGKRIRLLEIDTPETAQKCYDKNNEKYLCGIMAKEYLVELIGNSEVMCEYEKLDIYQRILGQCYVDGISINAKMVESGMAVVFSYSKFDDKLKNLQENARKNKLGIWQGKFELPKDYRKRKKNR